KLGRLKVRWSRKPGGVPKMVTLKKTADGRYFVTMMVEEACTPKAAVGRVVGIDLGIKDLVVTSHGEKLANLRPLKRLSWQLRRQQRRLSRQRKGSNRWHCQRRRVARLHARSADMRSDMAHKITRRLGNENQVIAIETLNVAGMMKNRRLARSISDAAFSEIVRQLRYKAAWDGRTLVEIDQWFPSSKRCSNCEHTLDELRLDQREWTCPKCGTHHDRDINAAINIEREGLKLLTPRGTGDVRVEGDTSASATAHAVTLAASVETRTRQSIGTCLERVTDD